MKKPVVKRLSATLAVCVVGLAMAACSSGSKSGGGKVHLTFWTHTHPPMIALNKQLITEYEKANPNVTIDYQQIPNTDFNTKMLTSLSNGSGPDVINMDDVAIRGDYIPKNLLAPMDSAAQATAEGRYLPHTLDGATSADGKLYGLPTEFNATAFAINKAAFTKAGLDPAKPPKAWDDVAADGQKLIAAGQGGFNFLYLSAGQYTQQLQILLNETGGRIVSDDGKKATIAEPAGVQALELWNTLINKDKLGDPHSSTRDATDPFADFEAGKTSMTIMYPWGVGQIKQDNPATFKNMEVVPLPQVDPSKPSGRWYGYYMAVNKASKHQSEAWKFINYVTSQNQRWLTDVNFIQPVKDWASSPAAAKVPFLPVWQQAYQQGRFDEVAPHWAEVQDAIKTAIESTVLDGKSADSTLNQASDTINQSLAE
ncbi:MAG TPA: sugar ABC transporter substrate-binding protein [Jatrophihabitantaceae bacterium]|jgi:ABC-type glycerol-3-phosphate transport system substrate-binding protein